jgi:hypothetical protein
VPRSRYQARNTARELTKAPVRLAPDYKVVVKIRPAEAIARVYVSAGSAMKWRETRNLDRSAVKSKVKRD